MEIQNVPPVIIMPEAAPAPAPAQPDGRAAADAVASKTAPRPDVPLPMPPSPSQTGLVSKAALRDTDTAPQGGADVGTSDVQRIMKPYGISMLPEKFDPPLEDKSEQTKEETDI